MSPIIWLIDSLFMLNTGFYDKGEYIKDRKKMYNQVLKKKFLEEIICFLPITINIYYSADESSLNND